MDERLFVAWMVSLPVTFFTSIYVGTILMMLDASPNEMPNTLEYKSELLWSYWLSTIWFFGSVGILYNRMEAARKERIAEELRSSDDYDDSNSEPEEKPVKPDSIHPIFRRRQ